MATPYASDWRMPKHHSETESQTPHLGMGSQADPATPPSLTDMAYKRANRQRFQRRMRGQVRQTRRGF